MTTSTNEKRPNILLITVDQMRYDCLSLLGHPVIETPNLDELARTGVRFDHAYSATPTCVPARAAIFTGQKQTSHGRVGYQDRVPWNYDKTLPGELAKSGYHTQCVGKMHVYPARSLLGFHNVILHDGYLHHNRNKHSVPMQEHFDEVDDYLPWLRAQVPGTDLLDLGLDCNASTVARPWALPEHLHPTNWTVSQSIDFLRRRDPSKPFFLWMSFVRPHSPLDPPQAYFDLYKDADFPDPVIGDWAMKEDPEGSGHNPVTSKGLVPKRRLRNAMAAYYALITHIDHQIGRFLQVLDEYGERNNTIILFTSDHGELMGDHHLFRKTLPYEGSTHIPFIVNDPGDRLGLDKGTVVSEIIELRDIMPSLLEAASTEIPDTVEGDSIWDLARANGKLPEQPWREYLHGEHAQGMDSTQWITDGREKYIWYSQTGEEQFFNLAEDPRELHNLMDSPQAQERIHYWRSVLIQELEGREEGYVQDGSLVVGRKPVNILAHLRSNE